MEIKSLYQLFTLILSSLTVFTSLLFCIQVLFIRNFKSEANKSLSLFFFGFMIIQLLQFIYGIDQTKLAQNLVSIFTPAVLILAPTFYLYVFKLTGNKPTKKEYRNHYLVPFFILILNSLLFLGYNLKVILGIENEMLNNIIANSIIGINLTGLIGIFSIQNIVYIYKTNRLLKEHKIRIQQLFSYEEGINLSWINTFFIGYITFIVLAYITNIEALTPIDWLFDALVLIYLIFVGFNGNRQIDIYYGIVPEIAAINNTSELLISNNIEPPALQKEISITDDKRILDLKQQVQDLIESEKLYLKNDLSLVELSKKLDSNTKYVSEAINKGFNKNFIALINDYRIQEAKKLLLDLNNNNLTIEALGNEAGFKSKSTFNTAFKKIVGMTPSEFKSTH